VALTERDFEPNLQVWRSSQDIAAFSVSRETEPRERTRQVFSFPFFADQLCVNWKLFAAIIAKKDENLVLNDLSRLQARYARNLLQSYLNAQSTARHFLSLPDLALDSIQF
jgi:hypothetical protein